MSRKKTSILLLSDDKEISSSVEAALAGVEGARLQAQDVSVANINGRAIELAAENDIVIFATDPENSADLTAIRTLDGRRSGNTVFLALTDSDIPLSRARALSDAGVDDVLPYPVSKEELTRQVDKWIRKVAAASSAPGDREGAVIPVIQARGGIGSTTVAVNLADHLLSRKSRFRREPGNSVALVDLDLQFGTIGDFLEIEPQTALMQMASGGIIPDAEWVEQCLVEMENGLDVLPAPEEFMPLDGVGEKQIEALVETLRRSHDYVVLDLPRALVGWIQPIMDVADNVILVTDTTVPSIRAAKRLIDFYKGENPSLNVTVVINHEKKPLVQGAHHKEASRALDLPFDHWIPHDPKAARTAVDFGKPLSMVAPRSDLNKAIAHLAKSTLAAMPKVEHATK